MKMNYLKEIIAFYDWNEAHPQSSGSISLWFALMFMNNKFNWKRQFSVSINSLMMKSGLTKKQFCTARKVLISAGRISIREKKGWETAIYTINPFFDEEGNQILEDDTAWYDQILKEPDNIICDKNCQSEISNGDLNFQKNEEIWKTMVPEMVLNESNLAPSEGTYINKLNETKQNETKLNFLKEDKSSSSECESKKMDVNLFFDEYNRVCTRLPKAKTLSKRRKQALLARAEEHGEAAVHEVIKLAAESNFLNGDSKSGWCTNFDWLFMPNNFLKILEGSYNNKSPNSEFADCHGFNNQNRYGYIAKPSPIEVLEEAFKDSFGDVDFNY